MTETQKTRKNPKKGDVKCGPYNITLFFSGIASELVRERYGDRFEQALLFQWSIGKVTVKKENSMNIISVYTSEDDCFVIDMPYTVEHHDRTIDLKGDWGTVTFYSELLSDAEIKTISE